MVLSCVQVGWVCMADGVDLFVRRGWGMRENGCLVCKLAISFLAVGFL